MSLCCFPSFTILQVLIPANNVLSGTEVVFSFVCLFVCFFYPFPTETHLQILHYFRLIRPLAMTNANIPRKKKRRKLSTKKIIIKIKKQKKIKKGININNGIKITLS